MPVVITMPKVDPAPALRYVQRCTNPTKVVNMLHRDLIGIQAALEVVERRAGQLREMRDSLLAELVAIDD